MVEIGTPSLWIRCVDVLYVLRTKRMIDIFRLLVLLLVHVLEVLLPGTSTVLSAQYSMYVRAKSDGYAFLIMWDDGYQHRKVENEEQPIKIF